MTKPTYNYEAILSNNKLPLNVRYAMLREHICEEAANRADRRELLIKVGEHLRGVLQPGRKVKVAQDDGTIVEISQNYWLFNDGTKAKFQQK